MKNILIFSIMVLFPLISKAQDRLITTANDTILGKIKEIGDDEIKYTKPEIRDDLVMGIDKNKVAKIIFENGQVMTFSNSLTNAENYSDNRKNAIKLDFISPMFNSTNITYERSLRPGRSFETTLGIIGLGWDAYDANEKGTFLKIGYKFIKSPDFYLKGQQYAHLLKGSYIRPEFAVSYYSYQSDYYYTYSTNPGERTTNLMYAFLLNFGKQWVIDDSFLFDWFFGVGYGFGDDDDDFVHHKAFTGGTDESPLAITMGLRIGLVFKK
jgi:hypothetical protein